jgi:hypothetical protein
LGARGALGCRYHLLTHGLRPTAEGLSTRPGVGGPPTLEPIPPQDPLPDRPPVSRSLSLSLRLWTLPLAYGGAKERRPAGFSDVDAREPERLARPAGVRVHFRPKQLSPPWTAPLHVRIKHTHKVQRRVERRRESVKRQFLSVGASVRETEIWREGRGPALVARRRRDGPLRV